MILLLAWLRLDVRRRWRSLVVLAVLVAVASGTVMTALAGAHRGATSAERLLADTLPIDAMVLPNQPGFDWRPFRELPYVEAMSEFALSAGPFIEGIDENGQDFLHAEADTWGITMERPIVLEGRFYDPEASNEAVITPQFAEAYHLGVGDTLTTRIPTPEQVDGAEEDLAPEDYAGPEVPVTIVGVVRTFWYADDPGGRGGVGISHGYYAKYHDNVMGAMGENTWLNAQFRLAHGTADIPQLRKDVARISGRDDIDVWNIEDEFQVTQRNLDFEARCLLAFGLAALVAGLLLVGQAITRYAAAETAELRTGRALGLTPRQTVVTSTVGPFLATAVGVGLAIAGSIVASRWFPIGTARGVEPDPGIDVDPVRLVAVAVVVILLATVGAGLSAVVSLRAAATGTPRRSPVATAVSGSRAPVPVVIGTRFALERGSGRTGVPVMPALLGAVVGVLGVIAVFSFSHGVDDAINHPERFGQTYQVAAFAGYNGQEFLPTEQMGEALRDLDYVTGVDRGRIGVATTPDGEASVELWSYDPGEKALPTVVTEGRMPESDDEVLLTPGSLDTLGAGVGETVAAEGQRAGPRAARRWQGFRADRSAQQLQLRWLPDRSRLRRDLRRLQVRPDVRLGRARGPRRGPPGPAHGRRRGGRARPGRSRGHLRGPGPGRARHLPGGRAVDPDPPAPARARPVRGAARHRRGRPRDRDRDPSPGA